MDIFVQMHTPCSIINYSFYRSWQISERAAGVPSGLKHRARFWPLTRKPGAMALARMPPPVKWVASHRVKLLMAAFATESAGILVSGM